MKQIIFDSHLHLPSIDGTIDAQKEKLLFDMAKYQLSGGVLITGVYPNAEMLYDIVDYFREYRYIYLVAGISPLQQYPQTLEVTKCLLREKKIVGVKIYPGHEEFNVCDPRLSDIFELCFEYNVPLVMHTGWPNIIYSRPNLIAVVARAYQEVKIVLCHMWKPMIDLCYKMTNQYENIVYDLSSIAYDQMKRKLYSEQLTQMLNCTPEKFMFGSDYSICDIGDHINLLSNLELSENKREMVFYKNALNIYHIKEESLLCNHQTNKAN